MYVEVKSNVVRSGHVLMEVGGGPRYVLVKSYDVVIWSR